MKDTEVGLVQDHDVREFRLLDQEVREGTVALLAAPFGLAAGEGVEELPGVEDGDEGVDAVERRRPRLRGEQPRDRSGFGDARRLHDQGVELAVLRQPDHSGLQVVLEFTADTPVREFGHAARDVQFRIGGHQVGVDVDRPHIVDQDGDVPVVGVGQDVVEKRRLPRPQAAGDDGHRNRLAHTPTMSVP